MDAFNLNVIYSSCNKACGVGGKQKRFRKFSLVSKHGQRCEEDFIPFEEQNCFAKCCDRDFYCHKSDTCVSRLKICDYNKDCANGEDEHDELCAEKCTK